MGVWSLVSIFVSLFSWVLAIANGTNAIRHYVEAVGSPAGAAGFNLEYVVATLIPAIIGLITGGDLRKYLLHIISLLQGSPASPQANLPGVSPELSTESKASTVGPSVLDILKAVATLHSAAGSGVIQALEGLERMDVDVTYLGKKYTAYAGPSVAVTPVELGDAE